MSVGNAAQPGLFGQLALPIFKTSAANFIKQVQTRKPTFFNPQTSTQRISSELGECNHGLSMVHDGKKVEPEVRFQSPARVGLVINGVQTSAWHMESQKKTKNPAAVALGRLGGLKGGKARAAKLTPEQRSEIARKGGLNRWPTKKS